MDSETSNFMDKPPSIWRVVLLIWAPVIFVYGILLIYVEWRGWKEIGTLDKNKLGGEWVTFALFFLGLLSTVIYSWKLCWAVRKKHKWAENLGEATIYILFGFFTAIYFSALQMTDFLARIINAW